MHVQTRAQRSWARSAGGLARIHGDIDRRQRVLVQAKGLSREALDAVACNGGTKGARGDAQTQTRITFMIAREPSRADLRTEALAALGTAPGEQSAPALRGHARAKAVGSGTMQIAGIKCAFHGGREAYERRQGY